MPAPDTLITSPLPSISPSSLTFLKLTGLAIQTVFDELAALRIAVFYDFPYLYEGSVEYEKTYLETYARAERSFLFAVYDGDRMVGATTALPLRDETAEVQAPFLKAGYDLDTIFYFGESILLPAYRGLGLGHQFFSEREAHAQQFGHYKMTCFCAVKRPADHPLRPADYQPLDNFWTKRGYQRDESLQSEFVWPDRNETLDTAKPMIYWTRLLP
ncbi:GNAT family N-acetyltransferase [Spirosoma sp. KCTC 42546]|uniref:GNAT family N-acetyltransferase n=1 Tax=Spirosoma sp. KCTC 42546 TaxID=2520506 RepID=UPI001156E11E|nr:GNAT family N-acetyltransferase [Spirosoma sp. KCTC 42546]QDK83558.1 GNAT family N-acetyltransferase [Spirosoma sp. KCTC 42546]